MVDPLTPAPSFEVFAILAFQFNPDTLLFEQKKTKKDFLPSQGFYFLTWHAFLSIVTCWLSLAFINHGSAVFLIQTSWIQRYAMSCKGETLCQWSSFKNRNPICFDPKKVRSNRRRITHTPHNAVAHAWDNPSLCGTCLHGITHLVSFRSNLAFFHCRVIWHICVNIHMNNDH